MAASSSLLTGLFVLFFVYLAAGQCTEPKGVVIYNTQNINFSTPYNDNLNRLLDILTVIPQNTTRTLSIGAAPYTAYECYGNCGQCLVEARNTIRSLVPNSIGARLCTNSCYLRFENFSF